MSTEALPDQVTVHSVRIQDLPGDRLAERLDDLRCLATVQFTENFGSGAAIYRELTDDGQWIITFSKDACIHELLRLSDWALELRLNPRDEPWWVVPRDQITGTPWVNLATPLRRCDTCTRATAAAKRDTSKRKRGAAR